MTVAKAVAQNVKRAQSALRAWSRSGFISDRPDDVAYLVPARAFVYRVMAEGRGYETVVLRVDGEPLLVTAGAYVEYYRNAGVDARPSDELRDVIGALGREIAEPASVPPEVSGALSTLVEEVLGPGQCKRDDPIAGCRLVKHPAEVALIRRAAAAAEAGMTAAIEGATVGRRELDAAGEAELAMRSAGAEAFAFSTIVSSGPELGVMREVTSERELQTGDWVMIDLGCTVSGYNAEFARSIQIGAEETSYQEAYRAVEEAQAAAIELIRPGVPVRTVDQTAHDVLERAGFGSVAYSHLTGHGIGTAVWEQPFIGHESDVRFEDGMVVCVEPGVFIPGVGGVRIEDVVLVTTHGHELLTLTPKLSFRST